MDALNMCGIVVRLLRTLRSSRRQERNADWTRWLSDMMNRLNDTRYQGLAYTPRIMQTNRHTGRKFNELGMKAPWKLRKQTDDEADDYEAKVVKMWEQLVIEWEYMHEEFRSHEDGGVTTEPI
eukprot:GHVU01145421.1.p1 GENE.GHVU01145421.1~~GHVU01145421.1.p1  ORF type:complete len:123 (-),score=15.37 GHVU01145421.1:153-521(-)